MVILLLLNNNWNNIFSTRSKALQKSLKFFVHNFQKHFITKHLIKERVLFAVKLMISTVILALKNPCYRIVELPSTVTNIFNKWIVLTQ